MQLSWSKVVIPFDLAAGAADGDDDFISEAMLLEIMSYFVLWELEAPSLITGTL